jgi:hypothetical protein
LHVVCRVSSLYLTNSGHLSRPATGGHSAAVRAERG